MLVRASNRTGGSFLKKYKKSVDKPILMVYIEHCKKQRRFGETQGAFFVPKEIPLNFL